MSLPEASLADGFAKAAEILKSRDRPYSSLRMLKRAFQANPSVSVARTGYWAGLHYGDTAFSQACLTYLENTPGPHHDGWLRDKPARLSGLPPSAENLQIWAARQPAANGYVSVEDRLCYVLHSSRPFVMNGYTSRSHGMASALMGQGLDVVSVTRPGFPLDTVEAEDGQTVARETEVDGLHYRCIPAPNRRQLPGPDYALQAADRLTEVFKEMRPAMVMAASNHITAIPAYVAARRLGLPFFYEVRGFWEVTRGSGDLNYVKSEDFRQQVAIETFVAGRADHVFTLTEAMCDELVRRGVRPDRISLAPNSCDPEEFAPVPRDPGLAAAYHIPAGVPVIGYIGAFMQYEGLDDLVRACAMLSAQGRDFRLLLVGAERENDGEPGPVTRAIREIAESAGIADKLVMPGRIPHEAVAAHYSLVDIAPFPRKPQAVSELVSPIKPLEAMSMEKAVVASSVRALTEIVTDGQTGVIFRKGDVDDLASVLDSLLSDPERRRRLGQAGRAWVMAERTWTITAGTVAAQMRRIAGERGRYPHDGGKPNRRG